MNQPQYIRNDARAAMRNDARVLRTAARILRRRSTRPRSFLLAVLCRVLKDAAAKLDRDAEAL